MRAQSKTIGMAIGVVLIIAIFTGVVLSSRGQAISSEISGNSEGGAALSLANTEDTEIIINELASEIPETGFFALGPDNYHEYTKEKLFDYYGIEFDISSVFPDMIEENTGSYGIFKFSERQAGITFLMIAESQPGTGNGTAIQSGTKCQMRFTAFHQATSAFIRSSWQRCTTPSSCSVIR